jgi:hypothetical protein
LVGLAQTLRENDWAVTATVHMKDSDCPSIRAIESDDTTARNFGVAIDVGTTTIGPSWRIAERRRAGRESHNHQARYGAM